MSLNVPSILFTFTIVGARAGADPKVQLRIEPKDLSATAPDAAKNSEPAPAKRALGSATLIANHLYR